jgi:hypothetical protein
MITPRNSAAIPWAYTIICIPFTGPCAAVFAVPHGCPSPSWPLAVLAIPRHPHCPHHPHCLLPFIPLPFFSAFIPSPSFQSTHHSCRPCATILIRSCPPLVHSPSALLSFIPFPSSSCSFFPPPFSR